MRIVVDIDAAEVLQDVNALAERAGGGLGPDHAGPAISREIATIEREWFKSQGQGTWAPLAGSTITMRANRLGHYAKPPGPGVSAAGPILHWTSRLRNSLADPRGRGAADAFITMRHVELVQGTMVPYAIYHQGGKGARKRPPVKELKSADTQRLAAVYQKFVLDGGV